MPYLPLPNFNHDSGPRRIQSGPDHEGYVVLYSGVQADGADEGFVVAGSPLSGTTLNGAWDYDGNWRYVPGVLPDQSGSIDPTPYNASGAILDTYKGTRIATRTQVAGAQAADAIGPEANVLRPRQAPLQPHADVTQREKYMYFGGAAPDNQGYSPYNTPDANTPAEGRTGGPVTHRNYENTLLTNVFGTQGTSDRSQWRYHQPVYCKTYTETLRSQSPGLMSTPLRYIYRGNSTQYNESYDLGIGFAPLNYDEFGGGCDIPPPCPTTTGDPLNPQPGDILRGSSFCTYDFITWYNTLSSAPIGTGDTYTIQDSDYFSKVYYVVTYPNGSTGVSDANCLGTVDPGVSLDLWVNEITEFNSIKLDEGIAYCNPKTTIDKYGFTYVAYWVPSAQTGALDTTPSSVFIRKLGRDGKEIWTKKYNTEPYTIGGGGILISWVPQMSLEFDTTNQFLYLVYGKGYLRATENVVIKIKSQDGSIQWSYSYNLGLPESSTAGENFKRGQWDPVLNKLWVLTRRNEFSVVYNIDPDDPSTPSAAQLFKWRNASALTPSNHITEVSFVRSLDGSVLWWIVYDDINFQYIYKADEQGIIDASTPAKRYSLNNSTGTNEVNPHPIALAVTYSTGLEGFIVAFSRTRNNGQYRGLVLYDDQFNIVRAITLPNSMFNILSISLKDSDTTKLIVACTGGFISSQSTVNRGDSVSYEVDSNLTQIKTISAGKIVSQVATQVEGFPCRVAAKYDSNVNRAITTTQSFPNNRYAAFGIRGIVTIGIRAIGSGLSPNLNYGNPSGYTARAEANIGVSQAISTTLSVNSSGLLPLISGVSLIPSRTNLALTAEDTTGMFTTNYSGINFT